MIEVVRILAPRRVRERLLIKQKEKSEKEDIQQLLLAKLTLGLSSFDPFV
jgi:hypothetical protein